MECDKIRERFSDYVEEVVSPEERTLIEGHLHTCGECRAYFAEMRGTVEYVRGLEEVEPPGWLSRRVMERIKSEAAPKRGTIERLFYPLHIKLPLQAAVAIFLAVTTFYIFRTMEPELRVAKAPSEETAQRTLPRPEKSPPAGTPKNQSVPPEKAKESSQKKGSEGRRVLSENSGKRAEPERQPQSSVRERTPAPGGFQSDGIPSAGVVARESHKTETMPRSPETIAPTAGKEKHMRLVLGSRDVEAAAIKVEEAILRNEGKIIGSASLGEKRVVTAELDGKKLKELTEQLKPVGKLLYREERLGGPEGNVRIDIEIIQSGI